MESRGLTDESYQLAFTPSLLQHIFGTKISDPNTTLSNARFVHIEDDANWWIRSGRMQYLDGGETIVDAQIRFFSPISYTDPFGSLSRIQYYKDYFLLMESTEDALGNISKVERFNFRMLSPELLRDANDNLSAALLDELGLVKATALLGKDLDEDLIPELNPLDELTNLEAITENEAATIQAFFQSENSNELATIGATLIARAGRRFVYDLEAYQQTGEPARIVTIDRETHHHQLAGGETTKLQMSFEYSDGLGNVAMTKVQAEPGMAKETLLSEDNSYVINEVDTAALLPAQLRWVGNGRTIRNNKGKPVKQYEPYFSITPKYENAAALVETGFSPVFYYDAPGRLVKKEFPDETFSKVEFNAWHQLEYDQNDTVLESQWYQKRINHSIDAELTAVGKDPVREHAAAQKAAEHADTPTALHFDAMGRPILRLVHNRDTNGLDEFYPTRILLDIEGNVRSLIDARGNTSRSHQYNMLGQRVYENGLDTGEHWTLNSVMGKPALRWDSRQHVFAYSYDELQRLVSTQVSGGPNVLNHLYERTSYGDVTGMTNAERTARKTNNQIGQVTIQQDSAGRLEFLSYDAKGNLLRSQRRLLNDYQQKPDWGNVQSPALEDETFQIERSFDALNRIQTGGIKHWQSSLTNGEALARLNQKSYHYNEANFLDRLQVIADGGPETTFVTNIDYDAKGQRTQIIYTNGLRTRYFYDPATFRLVRLATAPNGASLPSSVSTSVAGLLQDLKYTYDPVGNIMAIRNDAEDSHFFNNQKIEPSNEFSYDALYRLIFATGRDHVGQGQEHLNTVDNQFDAFRSNLPHAGDGNAMQIYRRHYRYDEVGNMLGMDHHSGLGAFNIRWRKIFQYSPASNQLTQYSFGNGGLTAQNFTYDAHGNLQALNATYNLQWDCLDQIQSISLPVGTAFYTYDNQGQRIRKVIDDNGTILRERIYLGGFEVFRAQNGLERETLHLEDDTGRIAIIETKTVDAPGDNTPGQLVRFQFDNHLGSASLEVNDSGGIISYEEYYPFGTTAYQSVSNGLSPAAKRYRFAGAERDEESGLDFRSTRYYASWLARWCNPDRANQSDGSSSAAYGVPNPVPAAIGAPNLTSPSQESQAGSGQTAAQTAASSQGRGDRSNQDGEESGSDATSQQRTSTNTNLTNGVRAQSAANSLQLSQFSSKVDTRTSFDILPKKEKKKEDKSVGKFLSKSFEYLKEFIANIWDDLKQLLEDFWKWLTQDDGFLEDALEFLGHITWGSLGTAVGLLVTVFNLTIGNLVTLIHNLAVAPEDAWDYATFSIGGPAGEDDIIGNYGGLFNLGGMGAAVTLGPFVFFQGSGRAARARGHSSVRDFFANESPGTIYGSQSGLRTADHEEGHEDQNLLYGPATLFIGLFFSLVPNAAGASHSSGWYWYDRQANRWSGGNNMLNPNTTVHPHSH